MSACTMRQNARMGTMARLPDHVEWMAMSEITVIAVPCQLS